MSSNVSNHAEQATAIKTKSSVYNILILYKIFFSTGFAFDSEPLTGILSIQVLHNALQDLLAQTRICV